MQHTMFDTGCDLETANTAIKALGIVAFRGVTRSGETLTIEFAEDVDVDTLFSVVTQLSTAPSSVSVGVRDERTQLLLASDWTQLADSPLTTEQRALWVTYRQALRDVPGQGSFPQEVVWPMSPAGYAEAEDIPASNFVSRLWRWVKS